MYSYNEFVFDYDNTINESIIKLEKYESESNYNDCKFQSNIWVLEYRILNRLFTFDFNIIDSYLISSNKSELLSIIKCWIIDMLDDFHVPTIKTYLIGLEKYFEITGNQSRLEFDEVIDSFNSLNYTFKSNLCMAVININDYCSEIIDNEALKLIYELNNSFDITRVVRELPPSKDIIKFSNVVTHYFSTELSEINYRKFFPINLWWKITNIIPMRPSEFCNLKRNCIRKKDGKYYLEINRIKVKKVVTPKFKPLKYISIPDNLYEEIKEYIRKTDKFGKSETLISYNSLPHKRYFNGIKKFRPERFSIGILNILLRTFYEEVFFGIYKFVLKKDGGSTEHNEISKKVRLGDTRHLAFINLKRQGYHPIEIARLGGHTKIISQQHYFNHLENFVDLEILELMTNYKLYNNIEVKNIINTEFINEKLLKPSPSQCKIKLKIGYCTDPLMGCRVDSCMDCDYWRISKDEFIEKQDEIRKLIHNKSNELMDVCNDLSELYSKIYKNLESEEYYSQNNPKVKNELNTAARNIDKAIFSYINIKKLAERVEYYE